MLNRIKKLMLPEDVDNENKEIVPTYNRSGGLEKVHLDEDEYVKEIAYSAKGQRLLISFGNGVMNRYAYDAQNFRLKRMKSEKYTYSESATERTYEVLNGTTRQDIGYEYDLNGNILKKKNRTPDCGISGTALGVDALDNEYAYDAISRLINASGRESDANNESHRWTDAPAAGSPNASNTQNYTRNYTYDKVGNIKTLQQTGANAFTRTFNYTDNTLNNITVSATPTAFVYDVNGNMIQSGSSRFYEWNEHDQLVFFKVQAGGTPSVYAHYLYNSSGERVKKIVWDQQGNKEVTVYIDGVFEYRLKQEDGQDKEQNIIHVMDDAARIAQVRIGTEFNGDIGNEITYILDDHLGSSNTRLVDNGSIIDHQEYYPFGDTSLRTFSKKRYQYVGKEKDSESGLYYYGARYYAAWTCRFISVDPLASSYAHLTPYNNAGNKVINSVDIDGMQGDGETNSKGNTGGDPPPIDSSLEGSPNSTSSKVVVHQIDNPFSKVGSDLKNIFSTPKVIGENVKLNKSTDKNPIETNSASRPSLPNDDSGSYNAGTISYEKTGKNGKYVSQSKAVIWSYGEDRETVSFTIKTTTQTVDKINALDPKHYDVSNYETVENITTINLTFKVTEQTQLQLFSKNVSFEGLSSLLSQDGTSSYQRNAEMPSEISGRIKLNINENIKAREDAGRTILEYYMQQHIGGLEDQQYHDTHYGNY